MSSNNNKNDDNSNAADSAMSSSSTSEVDDDGTGGLGGGGSLLKQTLMNVDECFLYKLPPLATSGGYRAEQWDLAKPIQTCGFQVERRNNDLYLLFTTDHHSKLFALAKVHEENAAKSVEPVMDSSRYFVVQIQAGVKSAYVGFGFRDRDVALDLLGNLQQFQKSIQREEQAKTMKVAEIPKLAEGEKIHISFGGSNSNKPIDSANSPTVKKSRVRGGGPILLKKPPKVDTAIEVTKNETADLTISLEKVLLGDSSMLVTPPMTAGQKDVDDDDGWGDFEQA